VSKKFKWSLLTISNRYISYIDSYLRELNLDSEKIFKDSNLDWNKFLGYDENTSFLCVAELLSNIRDSIGETDFFLGLGSRIPLTAHGNLGAAVMASKNTGHALEVVERFAVTAFPILRLPNSQGRVEIIMETPFEELNRAVTETAISLFISSFSLLTGRDLPLRGLSLRHEAPIYADHYQKILNCDIEFSAAKNVINFDECILEFPIRTANTVGEKVMIECLKEEVSECMTGNDLLSHIGELVSIHLESSPSVSFIAKKLRVSERTLRRRLNEEGLNYRDIIRDIRYSTAIYYLENTDTRIEKIGWLLGYKETSNFRKAFKSVAGISPSQWRSKVN